MRWTARSGMFGGLLVVSGLSTGCQTMSEWTHPAPIAAGATTGSIGYSYRGGLATQTFPQAEPQVVEATKSAMYDLAVLDVRATDRGGKGTILDGRAPDGRRIRLMLLPKEGQTAASVQVGLFGDEPLSRALLDRIGIRLGNSPPEPIPAEVPSEPESNPFVSREGVPDSVMYRGMSDAGYRDTPVP
jgi:Protein of unknown function (DUF3568)